MKNWDHVVTNTKLISTSNYLEALKDCVPQGKCLLVTSKGFTKRGQTNCLLEGVLSSGSLILDEVIANPEVEQIDHWIERYCTESFDSVIALGGGSVIDTAKVLRGMLSTEQNSVVDLIRASPVDKSSPLLIAIPTTAGTGAEVTPFATVWDKTDSKKHSFLGASPDIAILDPSLTLSLNREQTLYPALDALSHSLESIWNVNSNERTIGWANSAIECICDALPMALKNSQDLKARRSLQEAAFLAGAAISETKTAIAHAISYPLTLRYDVPHGLACSFTLRSIINEYDHENLNLSYACADKVCELLKSLRLEHEVSKFVAWPDLLKDFNYQLDPSRAGNFIGSIEPDSLKTVLHDSAGALVE